MPNLVVELPDNVMYQKLTIFDPVNPRLWVATNLLGRDHCLSTPQDAELFFTDVESSLNAAINLIYLSVSQDADGRHHFVSLGSAASVLKAGSGRLSLCAEAEVKELRDSGGAVLLFAKAPAETNADDVGLSGSASKDTMPARDAMCPKSSIFARNYDVIPELSIGITQKLILCDEATLMRELPEEKIFEHLKLIVNCHENAVPRNKYKVGSCTIGEHPLVICQAVHGWHSRDAAGMNRKNDDIQRAIWEQLQHGTVAVHCLAGIHRAACIVACHFLWRHYALGHTEIPSDPVEIYCRLQAARPAVDPAYEHVLRAYEAHLKKRTAPLDRKSVV